MKYKEYELGEHVIVVRYIGEIVEKKPGVIVSKMIIREEIFYDVSHGDRYTFNITSSSLRNRKHKIETVLNGLTDE